ncbi:hypothetical protein SSTU70S_00679 [Stutzerimonas stutzeri]
MVCHTTVTGAAPRAVTTCSSLPSCPYMRKPASTPGTTRPRLESDTAHHDSRRSCASMGGSARCWQCRRRKNGFFRSTADRRLITCPQVGQPMCGQRPSRRAGRALPCRPAAAVTVADWLVQLAADGLKPAHRAGLYPGTGKPGVYGQGPAISHRTRALEHGYPGPSPTDRVPRAWRRRARACAAICWPGQLDPATKAGVASSPDEPPAC